MDSYKWTDMNTIYLKHSSLSYNFKEYSREHSITIYSGSQIIITIPIYSNSGSQSHGTHTTHYWEPNLSYLPLKGSSVSKVLFRHWDLSKLVVQEQGDCRSRGIQWLRCSRDLGTSPCTWGHPADTWDSNLLWVLICSLNTLHTYELISVCVFSVYPFFPRIST